MTDKEDTNKKYIYNSENDTYIIEIKNRAKPLVFSGAKHRAIVRAISNTVSTSDTLDELSNKFRIPVKYLEEYKKIFHLTRTSLPLTDEEIESNSIEKSADDILQEKKFDLFQAFEKLDWKETQKEAASWREFQARQLDPITLVLDNWKPPKLSNTKVNNQVISDKVLVIGLSDIHYGSASNAKYMFNRPDWTTEKTVECVSKFSDKIIESINERKYKFNKVLILGMGDLIHSANGKTSRGTELKYDCIREEQFEYALSSLTAFILKIVQAIPNAEVHSVYGNHNYEAEMALFRALEMYFKPDERIKFFHYASRPAAFKEGKTLLCIDHGADSVERAYVPTGSDSKIQLHVQSLLLSNPSMLIDTKSKLFLTADKHHWEHLEYNDFEFIMFGTLLGGDEHANVHNLRNRPRQSCLILDENGLSEIFHVYFD